MPRDASQRAGRRPVNGSRAGRILSWGAVVLIAGPALLAVLGAWLLPEHNSGGQCEGIGWGCSPAPADALPLVVVLTLPYWLGAGLLALVVAVILDVRARRSAS